MSNLAKKLMMGAAGAAGEGEYIEDIFSTYLYTGNSSTNTITNGIDLAGEGGLVWIKKRLNPSGTNSDHCLFDSLRGSANNGSSLKTNSTAKEVTGRGGWEGFTSTGFQLDAAVGDFNWSGDSYASWTFRKAPGFFDVVTYEGNDGTQNIAHNLGSVPGCIIVKGINAEVGSASNWTVYHRSLGSGVIRLNLTEKAITEYSYWGEITDTTFSPLTYAGANQSGVNYIAYLFAHDEQIFGESGDQSVIKCGSVVTNAGTGKASVNLGWEPQWLLTKVSSTDGYNWFLCDNMRGVSTPVNTSSNPVVSNLFPNLTNTEDTTGYHAYFTPTGFEITGNHGGGTTVIYIAIRRGPMKKPESGTEVFDAIAAGPVDVVSWQTQYPVDMFLGTGRPGGSWNVSSRMQGNKNTFFGIDTSAEGTAAIPFVGEYNGGSSSTMRAQIFINNTNTQIFHSFRRAPGFFDVVAYTGTGAARTVNHNLGVAPELMIVKARGSLGYDWLVYHSALGNAKYIQMNYGLEANNQAAVWNSTTPTASVFSLGNWESNSSTVTYIAYLFASCPGVSKVGSYTGTGNTLSIDCGFTSGARFVLIKRTDPGSTGDWYVWDTARGIVAGNDPYLLLNSTAAENTSTDYIDPLSSGFQISSTAPAAINANGGTYIYLAIA